MQQASIVGVLLLASCCCVSVQAANPPCDNDGDCYQTAEWRCLPTTKALGKPCVLDYYFNRTGFCACNNTGPEGACVPGVYPAAEQGKTQYLVVGDSISMGYFPTLKTTLAATHQSVHAPGNNDNTNWGSRCIKGWLGPDPSRWDLITMNWGAHDSASPAAGGSRTIQAPLRTFHSCFPIQNIPSGV